MTASGVFRVRDDRVTCVLSTDRFNLAESSELELLKPDHVLPPATFISYFHSQKTVPAELTEGSCYRSNKRSRQRAVEPWLLALNGSLVGLSISSVNSRRMEFIFEYLLTFADILCSYENEY